MKNRSAEKTLKRQAGAEPRHPAGQKSSRVSRLAGPRSASKNETHRRPAESAFFLLRRQSRPVFIGPVQVGGGAPVSVQTMTKTDTRNAAATLAQIRRVANAGCDIVRIAVPDADAAAALRRIVRNSPLPIVADIHFDHRLALLALEAGAAALRLNPGNIGSAAKVREVARAASERRVPIRIGVNAGSLEKDLLLKYGAASAEAMAESALRHAALLERCGFYGIKLSVKACDVARTVRAYEILAQRTDYPLHLGLTEAGTALAGSVRSGAALGALLLRGIGDTVRISLAEDPVLEVRAALELLSALALRPPQAPRVVACPACGRARIDVRRMAARVEAAVAKLKFRLRHVPCAWPTVAVMGCEVNGPGEAREADVALVGGKGRAAVYLRGRHAATVPESAAVAELLRAVEKWLEDG